MIACYQTLVCGNRRLRALRHWFVGTEDVVLGDTDSWGPTITCSATLVRANLRCRALRHWFVGTDDYVLCDTGSLGPTTAFKIPSTKVKVLLSLNGISPHNSLYQKETLKKKSTYFCAHYRFRVHDVTFRGVQTQRNVKFVLQHLLLSLRYVTT
jgi:hypothetical protein